MCLNSITALLQFTTILPLGKPVELELFAQRSYLYPLAGYVIGALACICIFLIPSPAIAAAVAITACLLISGCNHFDGLLDLGDALMAHGPVEKRIRALTDHNVGSGGIALGLTIILITFAALQNIPSILAAIITAEVFGKFSMAILTSYGKPFREGIHSYFHNRSKPHYPLFSALLCLPLFLLPIPFIQIVSAGIVSVVCSILLLAVSYRLFGGVNGDVVGASNEISRAFVVLTLALFATI